MPVTKLNNAIQAAYYRIKFKDIFDLKELYFVLKEWLLEYGWGSSDPDGNPEGEEWWESMYMEREGGDGSKEHLFWWRLQKIPTDNSYYRYHLDIDFRTLGIVPSEVVRDGKKLKVVKGEVEIKVWAFVEFDYKGEWSTHPVLRLFNKIFPNRIFSKDLYADHKRELYREAYVLNAFIKKWFQLKRFLPFEEVPLFYPSKSYPTWKSE